MKCPKCGYLGFETVDRCRNCGYDFSLSPAPAVPELTLRGAADAAGGPLDDLALAAPAETRAPTDTIRTASAPADRREPAPELPLFGAGATDDAPLITRPSPPRPPLSVRRATPDVPRLRAEPRPSLLDQMPEADEPPLLWRPTRTADVSGGPTGGTTTRSTAPASESRAQVEGAGLVARATAGLIDLMLLLAVDAVVIYFTMQITGLSWGDIDLLPKVPLAAYFVIQHLGYFTAFTAGGQTLGKMVTGIRVVAVGSDRPPDASRALLRTTLWLLLMLPVGLGLASVLLDADKRGLHDRFARTRVVRATS